MLSSSTEIALAAMSYLAEGWDEGRRASSMDIAKARNLSRPFVAKVLTILSRAGLVTGTPGPGGGYRLARPPAEIRLADLARPFERAADHLQCPYGPDYCGAGPKCPVHDDVVALHEAVETFLDRHTLESFRTARPWNGGDPTPAD